MQGYAARDGFGMILSKNQMVEAKPRKIKEIRAESRQFNRVSKYFFIMNDSFFITRKGG